MSFEVGDRVYSLLHGWGDVVETDPSFVVLFEFGGYRNYAPDGTYDGYIGCRSSVVLFHGIPEIIAPPEPDRRPAFEIDTPIMVRDDEKDRWKPAHFAKWESGNSVRVWDFGKTSHTSKSTMHTMPYNYWKEVDE